MTALLAIIGGIVFLTLVGVVGLITYAVLLGERQKRILAFEYRLKAIEQYLERLNEDMEADLNHMAADFPFSGMRVQTMSVDEILQSMKQSGDVDENATAEDAMRKFFEKLMENQDGGPEDEDGPPEKWRGK